MRILLTSLSLLLLVACGRTPATTDTREMVANSALIVVGVRDVSKRGGYRLTEVLKNDGGYPFRHKVGDLVRLGTTVDQGKDVGNALVVFIGKDERGDDIMNFRDYSAYSIFDGKIPSLDCGSLEQLRLLAAMK